MTSNSGRALVLEALAGAILARSGETPLRIAVDGRTASGKTTLADELAEQLRARDCPVIRTSIDGFHRPRAERYARGRHSAEGYYFDARDLAAVRAMLLDPLGPGGDRRYRTQSFDLQNDRPVDQAPQTASERAVLIVDGTFLLRPELRAGWDVTVFVQTSETTAERRGLARDVEALGGEAEARRLYAERYRPAFEIYDALCAPLSTADVVIDNEDLLHPLLQVRGDGALAAVDAR